MRADILTTGVLDTEKWAHDLMIINHVDPKTFWTFFPNREVEKIVSNMPADDILTAGAILSAFREKLSAESD